MNKLVHSAYVIARRDFTATVMSRTFLLFLLAPLLVIGLSIVSGNIGKQMAEQDNKSAVAVVATAADFAPFQAAYDRVKPAFRDGDLPELIRAEPDYVIEGQVRDLLASRDKPVLAVMTGGIDRPRLTGAVSETSSIRRQMTLVIDEARQQASLARAGTSVPPATIEFVKVDESAGSTASQRMLTGRAAQFILFFLTVFLAGMVLSQLIEEKSNKVIEVLAAAVPIDAVFFGKLFAMLAVSLVGIVVWGVAGGIAYAIWSKTGVTVQQPAVGWPIMILLGFVYYAFNYLLLGGLFLGLGSQAATVREVQTLSMPVTIGQTLVFFLASMAVGAPDGLLGLGAAIFPFSSPLTMISRAAQLPELWPHLLAIAWQSLWVWLVVKLSAGLFRRNVMKSGSPSDTAARRSLVGRLARR